MALKIIYTAPYRPTFVSQDIEKLSAKYNVVEDILPWQSKWLYPSLFVIQLVFLLFHIPQSKAVVCSFGGYWCFWPTLIGKIFNTPVYIILNGTDCCSAPNLDYGVLRKSLVKKACQISYRNATALLPVSGSLMYSADTYSGELIGEQGIKTHFPELKAKSIAIHNGFDKTFWVEKKTDKLRSGFITVMDAQQFVRRDGQLLLDLFEQNEAWKLTLIGSIPSGIRIPKNVEVFPFQSQIDLRNLFSSHAFFIQLSLYEGFGCALCEAMLCGCIPIGTAVNHIPEIIGENGLVLKNRNLLEIESQINLLQGKENLNKLRVEARNHIINHYSIEQRINKIESLIEAK